MKKVLFLVVLVCFFFSVMAQADDGFTYEADLYSYSYPVFVDQFEAGSYELTDEQKLELDIIAQNLKARKGARVFIPVDVSYYRNDQELALARAKAVTSYLKERGAQKTQIIKYLGDGTTPWGTMLWVRNPFRR